MDETVSTPSLPDDLQAVGLLKFELLATGIKITAEAEQHMSGVKGPIRTRSGASGGLDIILPHDVFVNCPTTEKFAADSNLLLDFVSEQLVVRRGDEVLCPAQLQPAPCYYSYFTSDGIPMVQIGQICSGDRFCYGMTGPYCVFWQVDKRCKFCSIALNRDQDAPKKHLSQMLEVLAAAVEDPVLPARHVLIGGGTPNVEDMGAVLAAQLCEAIKGRFDISCYVMITAPLENQHIDLLWQSGADELGMNIEFYSDDAWRRFIPGKEKYVGKRRYFEALEYAVARFGPVNTRSILVVGLEAPEFTIAGAEHLASIGVMPILSPFRPLTGTELEHTKGFDYKTNFDIYAEVHRRSMHYGIPTGPTCIACQNNTLALPLPGTVYHYY